MPCKKFFKTTSRNLREVESSDSRNTPCKKGLKSFSKRDPFTPDLVKDSWAEISLVVAICASEVIKYFRK